MYAQIAWLVKEVSRLWAAVNSKGTGSGSGGSGATVSQGASAPEGSVTGKTNDIYFHISGGVIQRQYVKTTASGNTGWV